APGTVGLLPTAMAQATGAEQRHQVGDAQAAATTYAAVHQQIRVLDDSGQYTDAVKLATSGGQAATAFASLDSALATAVDAGQDRFSTLAGQAGSGLGLLVVFAPIVAVAAGALAALGLRARLQEYR